MLIQLFHYWSYSDYPWIVLLFLVALGVLWFWGEMWVKGWSLENIAVVVFGALLIALATAVPYNHSQVARGLAEGERGVQRLMNHVEREQNRTMAVYFNRKAQAAANKEQFLETIIPAYARELYEKNQHLYLPVQKEWPIATLEPDIQKVLDDVYCSRGAAELEQGAMKHSNCDKIYRSVCQYMARVQQEENHQQLLEGYPWGVWASLASIMAMVIVGKMAYSSIETRYCHPYAPGRTINLN